MATSKKKTSTKKTVAKANKKTSTKKKAAKTVKAKSKAKTVKKKTNAQAAKKSSTKKKTTKKKAAKKKTSTKSKSTPKTSSKAKAEAAKAAASAMKDIIARARDHFRQAPEQHHFILRDGRALADLKALAEALEDMHEHVFSHHVVDDRHDFANWVHDVLHERALAEQLRRAHAHPETQQRIIYRHIVRRVW